ncbi:hypothetical protein OG410_37785 [Streptomyces sp. NBC_00659]|uniref:hypothetical protein n=1 Tax=Streptomyces sp. NBC_00659 TaxID=2903669 RepID=UPI002E36A541|nr:hypothetical protein [Streptomyces sp. NBC_00659]
MRHEATACLEETGAAERRAEDLAALATVAREHLAAMDPRAPGRGTGAAGRAGTITGAVPKPLVGVACSMAEWFKVSGRLVPDELTDAAWASVEPIIKAWEPPTTACARGA